MTARLLRHETILAILTVIALFVLAMLALPSLKRSRGPAPARETVRE